MGLHQLNLLLFALCVSSVLSQESISEESASEQPVLYEPLYVDVIYEDVPYDYHYFDYYEDVPTLPASDISEPDYCTDSEVYDDIQSTTTPTTTSLPAVLFTNVVDYDPDRLQSAERGLSDVEKAAEKLKEEARQAGYASTSETYQPNPKMLAGQFHLSNSTDNTKYFYFDDPTQGESWTSCVSGINLSEIDTLMSIIFLSVGVLILLLICALLKESYKSNKTQMNTVSRVALERQLSMFDRMANRPPTAATASANSTVRAFLKQIAHHFSAVRANRSAMMSGPDSRDVRDAYRSLKGDASKSLPVDV